MVQWSPKFNLLRPNRVDEAYDVLLARAGECQNERGMLPNVIAVDFYKRGDVVGVARTLNRVTEGAALTGP